MFIFITIKEHTYNFLQVVLLSRLFFRHHSALPDTERLNYPPSHCALFLAGLFFLGPSILISKGTVDRGLCYCS
jgi:hypothetical protein